MVAPLVDGPVRSALLARLSFTRLVVALLVVAQLVGAVPPAPAHASFWTSKSSLLLHRRRLADERVAS